VSYDVKTVEELADAMLVDVAKATAAKAHVAWITLTLDEATQIALAVLRRKPV
jgi:hypothetical protein